MGNESISTLRVPETLMAECETIAAARRRATGANCHRSEIAREAMAIGLKTLAARKQKP